MSTARTARRRTLWEEGRQPGRQVTRVAALLTFGLVAADLGASSGLGWIFDAGFVLVCVAAALLVRPRDFFPVGVLPPLLMGLVVAALALVARGAIANARDGLVQAMVSGLAHRAGALLVGYALTLVVLALRQVALRNAGTLRATHRGRPAGRPARRVASRSATRPTAGSSRRAAPGASRRPSSSPRPDQVRRSAPAARATDPGRRTAVVPEQGSPVDEPRRSATGR